MGMAHSTCRRTFDSMHGAVQFSGGGGCDGEGIAQAMESNTTRASAFECPRPDLLTLSHFFILAQILCQEKNTTEQEKSERRA